MQTKKQLQVAQQMLASLEYDVEQLMNNVQQTQWENSQQLGFCSMFSFSSFLKMLKQAGRQYFPKLNNQLSKVMAITKSFKEQFTSRHQKQFIFQDGPFISIIQHSVQCLKQVYKYQILIKEKLISFSKQQIIKIQFFTKHLQQAKLSLISIKNKTQQLQKHLKQQYQSKIQNQSQRNLLEGPKINHENLISGWQIIDQSPTQQPSENQMNIVEQLQKENASLNEKMKLLQKQNNSLKLEIQNQRNLIYQLAEQKKQSEKEKNKLKQKIEDLQHEKYLQMKNVQNKQIEPKIKQDQVQKYINELGQKQQMIKSLKAENQKSSIELNKKIKAERDKCESMKKQYDQKILEVELNLQIANQKVQRISKQLQNCKKSYDKVSVDLQETKKQNNQLKQKLQEISNQNVVNINQQNSSIISNKDETIVILHQQLNESNTKIQELEKQLLKNKTHQTLSQELLQKVNQLTAQNKIFQKKIFTYILKINQLENQIAPKEGNNN